MLFLIQTEGLLAGSASIRTTAKSFASTHTFPRYRNLFLDLGRTEYHSRNAQIPAVTGNNKRGFLPGVERLVVADAQPSNVLLQSCIQVNRLTFLQSLGLLRRKRTVLLDSPSQKLIPHGAHKLKDIERQFNQGLWRRRRSRCGEAKAFQRVL